MNYQRNKGFIFNIIAYFYMLYNIVIWQIICINIASSFKDVGRWKDEREEKLFTITQKVNQFNGLSLHKMANDEK